LDISNLILESLTNNEQFVSKAFPYIKEEYFEDLPQQVIFRVVRDYIDKHHSLPDQDVILIDVEKQTGISDSDYSAIVDLTNSWKEEKAPKKLDWLLAEAESWCQDRAFYLAVRQATTVLDQSKSKNRGALPDAMRDALGVSFDTHVGHDYFRDWEERWKFYTDVREKIPFDLDLLNEMTEGGIEKKTLNVIMGGIHTGKTRFLCHLAAAYASMGLNVVYFTLEMAEYKIAQRIDANLLGVTMDNLKKLAINTYSKMIEDCKKKTKGSVVVKEFPTASAHVGHFRHVLRELQQKQDFNADVVIVDYINICASTRVKGITGDSYTLVKSIAEELRGLGQEFNIPVWSATQVTRAAFGSSDPDIDDVAESWGLPAVADWLGAIVVDDSLQQLNQFIIKQLKSRYSDKDKTPKGLINYNNELMRMTNAPNANPSFSAPVHQTITTPVERQELIVSSPMKKDFSSFKV
jgi:archaellum biogenesis ATPase FlaH